MIPEERYDLQTVIARKVDSGADPVEILKFAFPEHMKPRWQGHVPYLDLEMILMRHFDVPLNKAREIERWGYLNSEGELDDDDLRSCLKVSERASPCQTASEGQTE